MADLKFWIDLAQISQSYAAVGARRVGRIRPHRFHGDSIGRTLFLFSCLCKPAWHGPLRPEEVDGVVAVTTLLPPSCPKERRHSFRASKRAEIPFQKAAKATWAAWSWAFELTLA